jgi:hypothetical protein
MQLRVMGDTLARQMADELVLVNTATNKIFVANETGSRIWHAIQDAADLEAVIAGIVESAPDARAARAEIDEFIAGLSREGFVASS